MSLFYRQNAAARFFVDQTNGKVYEVVGGAAVNVKLGQTGLSNVYDILHNVVSRLSCATTFCRML